MENKSSLRYYIDSGFSTPKKYSIATIANVFVLDVNTTTFFSSFINNLTHFFNTFIFTNG